MRIEYSFEDMMCVPYGMEEQETCQNCGNEPCTCDMGDDIEEAGAGDMEE